jgi:hypothetical protein
MNDFSTLLEQGIVETVNPVNGLRGTSPDVGYSIPPCMCSFVGKARCGKTAYSVYATRQWKKGEEAFGLVPFEDVRPVFISANFIEGIDCIDFQQLNYYSPDVIMTVFDYLCVTCEFNVIFIDSIRILISRLKASEQQVYDILSGLSQKLGVYIFILMNSSKSNDLSDYFFGAASVVEKKDKCIDLSFDWCSRKITQRVFFGTGINELIPESESSLSERLDEQRFGKYNGFEGVKELLLYFINGPATVRFVKDSMTGNSMKMTYSLLKTAKEDGFLQKDNSPRSPYRLTERGCAILVGKKNADTYYRFLEDTFSASPTSPKCTSRSQCMLSTDHSNRACLSSSSAVKRRLLM